MGSNDHIKTDVNFNKYMDQFEYNSLAMIRFLRIKLSIKPKKINISNFRVHLNKKMLK